MTQNLPDRVSLALHHQMNPAGAAQLVKWINKGHRWAQTPVGRRIAFPGQDDPLNLPVRGLPLALSFRSGHSQATHSYPLCSMSRSSGGSSGLHPKSAQQRLHKSHRHFAVWGGGRTLFSGLCKWPLEKETKIHPSGCFLTALGKSLCFVDRNPSLSLEPMFISPEGLPG